MRKFFLFVAILITFCVCYPIFSVNYREPDSSGYFPPCLNNGQKRPIGHFQSGKSEKVDLMLTMGTWPGHDLANNLYSTSTLCLESSFPMKKNIKKITKFKILGVAKKSYLNINTWEKQ